MVEGKGMESKLGSDPYLIGISSKILLNVIDNLEIKWQKIRRHVNNEFVWEEVQPDEIKGINEKVKKTLKVALVPALVPALLPEPELTSSSLEKSLFLEYEQRKGELRKELKEIVRNSTANRDDLTLVLVHLDGGMVNTVLGEYEKAIDDTHFETALWANESLKNKEIDLMANYFLALCNFNVSKVKQGHEKTVFYRNVISRCEKVSNLYKEVGRNEFNESILLYYQLCAHKVQEFKYKAESELSKLELQSPSASLGFGVREKQAVYTDDYKKRLEVVAEDILNGLHRKEYNEELEGLGHLRDEVLILVEKELRSNVYDKEDREGLKKRLEHLLNRVLEIAPKELSGVHRRVRDEELKKLKHLLNKDLSDEEVRSAISSDPRLGILLGNVYRKIGHTESAVKTFLMTLDLTTGETIKRIYDPFRIMKEAKIRPNRASKFK